MLKYLFPFILFSCQGFLNQGFSQVKQPNIIVIMVDDLGYGDVGAYNERIDFTPHVDKLADEGMLFTDFHSNGPMCSPTRAAFLTGLYQYRFGERFEGALSAERKDKGIPLGIPTIASILKQEGYITGIFGKWHLGVEEPYLPNNYGFDEFIGLVSGDGDHHTHINRWGKEDWWRDKELKMEIGYATDLITNHSLEFMERNRDEPFFLFVSHLAIHFPWQGPNDPAHREKGGSYGNNKWGVVKDHNNVRPHVIEMIKKVDQSLGEVMDKLEELNLSDNTILVFTSDNGGYTHYYQNEYEFENISDNGLLRGQKAEVFEGGHRVPLIIYWPGQIGKGVKNDVTAMTMDLLPTFCEIVNGESFENHHVDGVSLVPLLNGKYDDFSDRFLFWKKGNSWAVRKGEWKVVVDKDKQMLFNLNNDISESQDRSASNIGMIKEFKQEYSAWLKQMNFSSRKWGEK